ncbi:hypothetical protein DFP73DRAFT_528416 [Morchella snyderi]|nr:hypothetical protein DFP73DRAFT_528416 [Morchella snyderi]
MALHVPLAGPSLLPFVSLGVGNRSIASCTSYADIAILWFSLGNLVLHNIKSTITHRRLLDRDWKGDHRESKGEGGKPRCMRGCEVTSLARSRRSSHDQKIQSENAYKTTQLRLTSIETVQLNSRSTL